MVPFYQIHTDRLVMRCYGPDDAVAMSETILRNHEHLIRWMPWAEKDRHTVAFTKDLIRKFRGSYDLGQDYPMGVFDRHDGRYVGGTGLHLRVGPGALEIGYWIDQACAGKGLATHVAAALTKAAFEYTAVHRMVIHMQVGNVASERIPVRLGYKREGLIRQAFPMPEGKFIDVHTFSLLREEYDGSDLKSLPLVALGFDGLEVAPWRPESIHGSQSSTDKSQ